MNSTTVDRTIALTRSLRTVANALMDRAHDARSAGEISLDEYFAVADRYQAIINQANMACYEAAEHLPTVTVDLDAVEGAAQSLEKAAVFLAKTTDVLAISAQLLQALSSLVLAILNPQPAAFLAVATSIQATISTIAGHSGR
jgi:hypothetical protein